MLTKDAAYFEERLLPHLKEISDRTARAAIQDLVELARKKEKEAAEGDSRPRPIGEEYAALAAKLQSTQLNTIATEAGAHVKQLVLDLMQYIESMLK